MKITRVTPFVLGTVWRELLFVKVETDEGVSGWGEVRPVNKTEAVIGYLREAAPRYAIGRDPFDTELLVQEMMLGDFGRPGEVAMSALACLEVACWDIKGKVLGQPIYRLLGGAVRPRIKLYANGWYRVSRDPVAFADAARAAVARGYRALKFDPFGHQFFDFSPAEKRLSIRLSEAVREAVGPDVELMIEMHGRFTPAGAAEMARELSYLRPSWFEEPVPPDNPRAMKKVMDAVAPLGIPVASGERVHMPGEASALIEMQAIDILQTDLTHFGGLMNTKKIAAQADNAFIRLAPHNVGGPVSTAAALHLNACTTNAIVQENFNDFDGEHVMAAAPGLAGLEPNGDGCVPLPEGPGLGVVVDESIIAAHPSQRVHFNLFSNDWHKRDTRRP